MNSEALCLAEDSSVKKMGLSYPSKETGRSRTDKEAATLQTVSSSHCHASDGCRVCKLALHFEVISVQAAAWEDEIMHLVAAKAR
eukprot:CAMPEP_0206457306 /NCGR_PEP_ID=MMETSP0324_2-20121206/22883_1 /ASSEMBLY_ACC=CAM_ASM_000836 /TAXON_ID=2866 /ORGANISM="Crypthecodinium cohnii, Strain Seligo" /LENGTH=84 /DNA_ID=CAMNT_0053928403 /DNA_START=43 /DNA_END=298 /DNA_ORIENTATION=+